MCNLMWFPLILLATIVHCSPPPTIRRTINGPIEGVVLNSSLGQPYYAFKGVRYAEAPITGPDPLSGAEVDRRFKSSEPLKRIWSEPQKADAYGKGCMQTPSIFANTSYLSEDCLFLNVYVPFGGLPLKPVLIFIHGGGWTRGDASDLYYGPDFLISRDIVVITIQYRLGIFGSLNLGIVPYTGNMALKDQQLALKWIWYNIANFSGDRQKILLAGESSGGAAVHFHLLNKESRKYFNRVYVGSGSVFNSWEKRNDVKLIQECSNSTDMNEMVKFLKTATNQSLLNCRPKARAGIDDQLWLPTIESSHIGAFLTQPPHEIYKTNPPLPIHTMFGFNSQEVIAYITKLIEYTEPLITADWQQTNLPFPFDGFTKEAHPEAYKEVVEKLRAAYYPDPTNGTAVRDGNIALLSNLFVNNFELYAVALQADINYWASMNTYLFRFSVHDAFNLVEVLIRLKYDGATHTDELCYMFHCHLLDKFNIYLKHLEQKDKSYDFVIRSAEMISNFARTGDPSIRGDTPFKSCKSSNTIYCQEVSNAVKTSVTYDIKQQLHYDVWVEIQKIYSNVSHANNLERLS